MTISQLSIFIENRTGTLLKVLDLMKQSQIQMIACTIAETAEYGIFRIICSEPQRACTELKQAGVAVAISDVFALELDNQPGGAADVVKFLGEAGVDITYMYAFLLGGRGILVFRTDEADLARNVIADNKLPYITEKDLAGANA
ncbi:MAG: amino acid-binding protein [Bacteroidales bacterium]|nr:amino acid-binding protein [Bacteroidales bacterium]